MLLGVGVLGGFTTFSSFSLETALMIERRQLDIAAVYVVASVVAGDRRPVPRASSLMRRVLA